MANDPTGAADESTSSFPELEALRAKWRRPPPPPDLRDLLSASICGAPDRLLALVQCDALERCRAAGLAAFARHDTDVSIAHYASILGALQPGTPLVRMIIRCELLRNSSESPKERAARTEALGRQYPEDLAAALTEMAAIADSTGDAIPPTDPGEATAPSTSAAPAPSSRRLCRHRGEQIAGRYELIDLISDDGAFGEVWLARRLAPTQRVAVKFIRPDRVNEETLRRFEQVEPKALARFNHDYIARLHDVGRTSDGVPFLAMEYVPGDPIVTYCDRRSLPVRDRIELLAKVCEAVHHIHMQGVIHRDLKPANILVTEITERDGVRAVPKLVDFGLARSINPASPLVSRVVTRFDIFAGTYVYASPEQVAARRAEDVDAKTDVYALGAVLFEMLVGVTPMFRMLSDPLKSEPEKQMALAHAERPTAAAVFAAMKAGERESVSSRRGLSPTALDRLLRSRLRHVLDTALRLERSRRFTDAAMMARDLRNYLDERDFIEAAAEPRRERMVRHMRRNKVPYAAAAIVLLALLGGITGTTWQAFRAGLAEQSMRRERDVAIAAREAERVERERADREADEARRQRARAESESYVANLMAAQFSMQANEPENLRARLDACAPELRGWEWRHLDARSDSSLAVLDHGENGLILGVSFSPDGARIVTSSEDRTARVWDTAAVSELAVLRGHEKAVRSASFNPDGTRIVTASSDGTARIWDSATGNELAVLRGHGDSVRAASFSPDGLRIVTASRDNTARVWDATTGAELAELNGHTSQVYGAFFSPDGSLIVTASNDGTARIWDSATGTEVAVLRQHEGDVYSASFSPDGSRIVTASRDNTARVWDATTGAELAELNGHASQVYRAFFSPDGARIVTSSEDRTARVWDTATGSELAVLRQHEGVVYSASFSFDGSRIVTASRDNTARVWNAVTGTALVELKGHANEVFSAAVSPDGTRIVTISFDGTARVWDASTRDTLVFTDAHLNRVTSVCFSPDDTRIVSASRDSTARVWDAATGTELAVLRGHERTVNSASFSPDGTRIITGSDDATVRLWDATTGAELAVLRGHGDSVQSAIFSPDGRHIISASSDHTASIWDAATGRQLTILRGHEDGVFCACFSPDGRRIVTASADNTAQVWDSTTGGELSVLRGHDYQLTWASFSPDGTRIVTACDDFTARVWDAVSGNALAVLRGHTRGVGTASFSPDGSRILTASDDDTVRIWDAATGAELAVLRSEVSGCASFIDLCADIDASGHRGSFA